MMKVYFLTAGKCYLSKIHRMYITYILHIDISTHTDTHTRPLNI